MTRDECTKMVLAAREAKGLTWQQIADAIGRHVVRTTAALLGQATMDEPEARRTVEMLGLGTEGADALRQSTCKGSLEVNPPTDPLIYRFYEIVQVYGTTLEEVIQEQFGDEIMSAIDFTMNVAQVPDPKGDRAWVTMEGKFPLQEVVKPPGNQRSEIPHDHIMNIASHVGRNARTKVSSSSPSDE